MYTKEKFPNFIANTTQGEIELYAWLQDSWAILFAHPTDSAPVCTTELSILLKMLPEFTKRDAKVIGLSYDISSSDSAWHEVNNENFEDYIDADFPIPIIIDANKEIANKLNIYENDGLDFEGFPRKSRAVYIIDPAKNVRSLILYKSAGRNFNDILRVLDSLQNNDKSAIPVNRTVVVDPLFDPLANEDFETEDDDDDDDDDDEQGEEASPQPPE